MYIIPIAIFGLMHFAMADKMVDAVPSWLPFGVVWVYITGLGLVAAPVALIIKKKAKLAMTLLGIELLCFAVLIHLMSVIGGDEMSMGSLLKDISLAGAAFYIASLSED